MAIPFQRMPGFEAAVPDVRALTQPLQQGLDSYRQGMDAQFKGEMLKKQDARADQEFQLKKQSIEAEREAKFAARMAGVSQHILGMPAEQQASAWGRMVKANPNLPAALQQYGVDPNDHVAGANFIIAQAKGYQDPMDAKMKQAELAVKYAQAGKLNREASEAGSQFGKQGTIIQDRNGNFYSVQFGAGGQRRVEPLQTPGADQTPVPLQPARGVDQVGDVLIDKATGGVVRSVAPNLQNAEKVKEQGQAQGKAAAAAPGDISAADNASDIINSIRNDPARERGTGMSAIGNMIPGTSGYDFQRKVEQAKSGAFLTAIQQLRGMGALSNAEGQTATSAVTRMSTAMTEQGFLDALADYEKIVQKGRAEAVRRQSGGQPSPNAQPAPTGGIAPGDYVWDGTQLVPKGR